MHDHDQLREERKVQNRKETCEEELSIAESWRIMKIDFLGEMWSFFSSIYKPLRSAERW